MLGRRHFQSFREYDCSGAALSLRIAPKPGAVAQLFESLCGNDWCASRVAPTAVAWTNKRVSGGLTYVPIKKRIAHAAERSSECAKQSSRDRQGPFAWPDHSARPLQVGHFHCRRRARHEE